VLQIFAKKGAASSSRQLTSIKCCRMRSIRWHISTCSGVVINALKLQVFNSVKIDQHQIGSRLNSLPLHGSVARASIALWHNHWRWRFRAGCYCSSLARLVITNCCSAGDRKPAHGSPLHQPRPCAAAAAALAAGKTVSHMSTARCWWNSTVQN